MIADARRALHKYLIDSRVFALRNGWPSNADKDSVASREIARHLAEHICGELGLPALDGPGVSSGAQGSKFAEAVKAFLEATMAALPPSRGRWVFASGGAIDGYAQYRHLRNIQNLVEHNDELRSALGGEYIVHPDVVVGLRPPSDEELADVLLPGDLMSTASYYRAANNHSVPVLHASVSCKWTFRSDRAQNARTEALNLIRNRKGRAPAIAMVTAEPLPSRLASLADGAGDLDRVYHFALYELVQAVAEADTAGQADVLHRLREGGRLADISDLPLDLMV